MSGFHVATLSKAQVFVGRTLVITNDFPPRPGGIQEFVYELVSRRPPGSVVVYAPSWPGARAFDASLPFPVVRHPGSLMLPEPSVLGRARAIARREGCTSVLYGAAAPLGLLTPALRRAGVRRFVALTHGHEASWARLPGARRLLRRIGDSVDVMTYVSPYTGGRLARALSPEATARMEPLAPGVDHESFRPGAGGAPVRAQLELSGRPTVVCVSRLVPRKGQDVLVRAWPRVLRAAPEAALLLAGGGPQRERLERLAESLGVWKSVVFTGTVPRERLPAYFDTGDVFAMPCRSRWGGVDTEGLGMVYLEAAAAGLPVVAGDAGGAPSAVRHGETGYVVDGRSPSAVADALIELLRDPEGARAMGERGRSWIERDWTWEAPAARIAALLDEPGQASIGRVAGRRLIEQGLWEWW